MSSTAPAEPDTTHPIHVIPWGPLGATPMRSCWNCKEQRSFQGAPVCLVHLAVVGRLQTCNLWDGGTPMLDQAGIIVHWYHNSIPSDDERSLLESSVELPPGPPPPTVRPYGRR